MLLRRRQDALGNVIDTEWHQRDRSEANERRGMIGGSGSEIADAHEAWLTLGEASHLLGVDPDTLRRWADDGKVDVFRTPGGHRRFLHAQARVVAQRDHAVVVDLVGVLR